MVAEWSPRCRVGRSCRTPAERVALSSRQCGGQAMSCSTRGRAFVSSRDPEPPECNAETERPTYCRRCDPQQAASRRRSKTAACVAPVQTTYCHPYGETGYTPCRHPRVPTASRNVCLPQLAHSCLLAPRYWLGPTRNVSAHVSGDTRLVAAGVWLGLHSPRSRRALGGTFGAAYSHGHPDPFPSTPLQVELAACWYTNGVQGSG